MVYFYLFQSKICLCENDAIIQPYKMFPNLPTVLSCSTYMSHSGIINKSSPLLISLSDRKFNISIVSHCDKLYSFYYHFPRSQFGSIFSFIKFVGYKTLLSAYQALAFKIFLLIIIGAERQRCHQCPGQETTFSILSS